MKASTDGRWSRLFWGQIAGISLPKRIVALVFTLVSIAALSFCQLAFFPIGEVAGGIGAVPCGRFGGEAGYAQR